MNGNETVVDISETVDAAFKQATPTAPSNTQILNTWATPEEYKTATGKRFRMTKEEANSCEKGPDNRPTPAARQAIFEARMKANLL